MKTAALYAQVSSDRQKEEVTIATQTRSLQEYAQANGRVITEVVIFQDERLLWVFTDTGTDWSAFAICSPKDNWRPF